MPAAVKDKAALLALHVRAYGLPEPEREHRFHPTRRWAFDLAWPDRRVAVEVEGGIWRAAHSGPPCKLCGSTTKGAHGQGQGITRDIEKYNEAGLLGWRVFRVTPREVDEGKAIQFLRRVLDSGLSEGAA